MEYQRFEDTYVVRLNRGEEVTECLQALCKQEGIRLGEVSGLGAADAAVVGLYNVSERKYYKKELRGMMEITSLVGNITEKDGEVYLHIHINLCDENLAVHGGHMNSCRISATGELLVQRKPG